MTKEKEKTAFEQLSIKHKDFFKNYLECLNATKAYMKAYPTAKYETAMVNGSNLLRHAKIQAALKEYYDQLWADKEDLIGKVFNKLLNVVDFDISDYVDKDGNIDLEKITRENSFPISEISRREQVSKYGTSVHESIKTIDKLKAIQELTKILGMIQEKVEHSGTIKVVPDDSL
jgi:phage terminase small subunit